MSPLKVKSNTSRACKPIARRVDTDPLHPFEIAPTSTNNPKETRRQKRGQVAHALASGLLDPSRQSAMRFEGKSSELAVIAMLGAVSEKDFERNLEICRAKIKLAKTNREWKTTASATVTFYPRSRNIQVQGHPAWAQEVCDRMQLLEKIYAEMPRAEYRNRDTSFGIEEALDLLHVSPVSSDMMKETRSANTPEVNTCFPKDEN